MAMWNNQRVHEITSWMVGTNSVPQECPRHQLKSPSFGCHMWPCRQRNTCQNRRISWSEFHLEYKQTAWWQHFSWLNLLKKETNNSDQLFFYEIISIPNSRLRCNGVTSLWTRLILRDMKTANERPLHFEEAGQARGAANGDSGSGKIDRSFCRKGHWSEDLIKKNPETWVRFWCCTIDKWRFPEMGVPVNHPFE